MSTHRRLSLVLSLVSLAAAACARVGPALQEACDERDTCPDVAVVDCMPVVPAERASACSEPCAGWLRDSCGVEFTH